jgi:hypothetical protein
MDSFLWHAAVSALANVRALAQGGKTHVTNECVFKRALQNMVETLYRKRNNAAADLRF